jgi:hypothetical protein
MLNHANANPLAQSTPLAIRIPHLAAPETKTAN